MDTMDLLADAYGRIHDLVDRTTQGLDRSALTSRLDSDANPIGWLIWHLTRVQDDHVSEIAGREQDWSTGWSDRFGMPPDPSNTGYGHHSDEVGGFDPVSSELLVAYHDEVHGNTFAYIERTDPSDLDRIIDRSWDPPVRVGVRLMSVIGDNFQHLGQAAYVRGVVERQS